MRPIFTALLSLFIAAPTAGIGQAQLAGGVRQTAFESLQDSQWVRLTSLELGRRQGRLLQNSPRELILSLEPQPLRVPAASIDTLWTRGRSTKTGLIVGALLGAGIGALAAASPGRDRHRQNGALGRLTGWRNGGGWSRRDAHRDGLAPMEAAVSVKCAPGHVLGALVALALGLPPSGPAAQTCETPYQVSRQEIREAMATHGPYSLTSTTTSMLFGSEALLAIVERRRREAPGDTHLSLRHDDWFAAHLATAEVPYSEMSASARAGFEHRQDVLVDYGPAVVERVLEGPAPITVLDVTIFWPDTGGAPGEFSYRDTLSVPEVDVFNHRVIRFKVLEYDSMLVFDRVTGISVRPMGFLSALFAVLGKPDLRETRVAVSADHWQVVRGRVKVFPGISKTATATIEPDGRGHEGVPDHRKDLGALEERLRQPVELRYGPPSCQVRERIRRHGGEACRSVMGGAGTCPGE